MVPEADQTSQKRIASSSVFAKMDWQQDQIDIELGESPKKGGLR